jgi:hypothetical protein
LFCHEKSPSGWYVWEDNSSFLHSCELGIYLLSSRKRKNASRDPMSLPEPILSLLLGLTIGFLLAILLLLG